MMIDTHCHISLKEDDYETIIKNMGNNIMIVSGADMASNYDVINLINKYPNVYGTIGIHPTELKDYTKENLLWIEEQLKNPKIVGIGEIGLDYYYEDTDKLCQKEAFLEQIHLAKKYQKPIVIHSRDAMEDTLEIIKNNLVNYPTVMHCYSGSLESAKELVKMGIHLGIGGVLTFKNASKLVKVVEEVDLKYLLLETDSPYLSPEPFRGKKNEPVNIKYVAEKIAEIKKIPVDKVFIETTKSAVSLFDLKNIIC